jgi:hypothetical protein
VLDVARVLLWLVVPEVDVRLEAELIELVERIELIELLGLVGLVEPLLTTLADDCNDVDAEVYVGLLVDFGAARVGVVVYCKPITPIMVSAFPDPTENVPAPVSQLQVPS